MAAQWWTCPNKACSHASAVHDIEDYDDDLPRCCVEGCDCGKRT